MIAVCIGLVVPSFAGRYNYQEIPTSSVTAGQILSAKTVASFASSRVRGLPTNMTEDMHSRLSEAEAASVRRWEHSAMGKAYVTIVRKVPFAVFISVGTVILLITEVMARWH